MAHFTRQAEARFGLELDDYSSLHQWSVDQPEHFWGLLWDYMGVISSQPYECVVKDVAVMPGAKWFPGARLNFAENLLVSRECELAVVFRGERGEADDPFWGGALSGCFQNGQSAYCCRG